MLAVTTLTIFIAGNSMKISRPIHSHNRSSRNYGEYICMLVMPIIELSPRDPCCNAKNENCMDFVILLGNKILDDILIANLVLTSGGFCLSNEYFTPDRPDFDYQSNFLVVHSLSPMASRWYSVDKINEVQS